MEISPGCSLEGLMLKLKLQYFGHLMWSVDSLENSGNSLHLMLGEVWGQEEKGLTEKDKMVGWHHQLSGHEFAQAVGMVKDREAWHPVVHRVTESDMTEQLTWLAVGEDSWESLDCKEIKPVNPKGNQPWIFIGRADAEVPILWPPDEKSWLIGKDPDAGKNWSQEEKGTTENEMVGWHHWLNVHEFEQTQKDSKGHRSLSCCSPWSCKELDTTKWLNNNNFLFG